METSQDKCVFSIKGLHRPLGVVDFNPNQVPIRLHNQERFQFQLGNCRKTGVPEEAAQHFIDREYPEISQKKENNPVFIPEYFLSTIPEVLNYEYTEEDTCNIRKLDKKYKKDGKISGDQSEFVIYQQLQEILLKGSDANKDIVVIHGWKNKWVQGDKESDGIQKENKVVNKPDRTLEKELEADFLVVSQRNKIILSIECKSNLSRPTCQKVLTQLNNTFEALSHTLSFGPDWKYVKACAFTSMECKKVSICERCKSFVIDKDQKLEAVWSNVLKLCPFADESSRCEFVEHIKRLSFLMYLHFQDKPIVKKNAEKMLLHNINKASTKENILMWTRSQFKTFFEDKKKILLMTPFGTGKTILLREKALQLALKEQERAANARKSDPSNNKETETSDIYFVNLVSYQCLRSSQILSLAETRHFFSSRQAYNVKVFGWEDVSSEVDQDQCRNLSRYETLTEFVKLRSDAPGIFIDEYSDRFLFNHHDTQRTINKIYSHITIHWEDILAEVQGEHLAEEKGRWQRFLEVIAYAIKRKREACYKIPLMISRDPSVQDLTRKLLGFLEEERDAKEFFAALPLTFSALSGIELLSEEIANYIANEVMDRDIGSRLKEDLYYSRGSLDGKLVLDLDNDYNDYVCHVDAFAYLESLATITEEHLWLAVNKDDRHFKYDDGFRYFRHPPLQNFCCPVLKHNLRSVREVIKEGLDGHETFQTHTNVARGRLSKVIRLTLSAMEDQTELLFTAFKEGLEHIGDSDDLAVMWLDEFGASFRNLQRIIVTYLNIKDIPVFVARSTSFDDVTGGRFLVSSGDDYVASGRKGIVLADIPAVHGSEFKSVIAYFRMNAKNQRMGHEMFDLWNTAKNVILRNHVGMAANEQCTFSVRGNHHPLGLYSLTPGEVQMKVEHLPKNYILNLGNGKKTSDLEEAAAFFMDREYPEISQSLENDPVFIPEYFISSIPEMILYDYTDEDTIKARRLDKKVKDRGLISGDSSERSLYSSLKDILLEDTSGYKDIAVLHGWKNKMIESVDFDDDPDKAIQSTLKPNKKKSTEIEADFLIVSQHHRMIVSIESKTTFSRPNCGKMLQQLGKTNSYLPTILSFKTDWKFVRVGAFAKIDDSKIPFVCESCKRFLVHPNQELNDVWKNIMESCPEVLNRETEGSRAEFVDHVKRLTFYMFLNFKDEPIVKSNASKKMMDNISKAGTKENIILWTKPQFATFYNDEKHVFLMSYFGTGKTVLLREKALQVAKAALENKCDLDSFPDVYFLVLPHNNSIKEHQLLLISEAKEFFQKRNATNVKVISWEEVVEDVGNDDAGSNDVILKEFIEKHNQSPGIFIDEFKFWFVNGHAGWSHSVKDILSLLKVNWPQVLVLWQIDVDVKKLSKKASEVLASHLATKKDFLPKIPGLITDDPKLQKAIDELICDLLEAKGIVESVISFIPKFLQFQGPGISNKTIQDIIDGISANELKVKFLGERFRWDQQLWKVFSTFKDTLGIKSNHFDEKTRYGYLATLPTLTENHLWVAVNKDDSLLRYETHFAAMDKFPGLERFTRPQLKYNLRNTQEIVTEISQAITKTSINMVNGRKPKLINLEIATIEDCPTALFDAFLEGIAFASEPDNLVVLWDTSYNPTMYGDLTLRIVNHLCKIRFPVYVEQSKSDLVELKRRLASDSGNEISGGVSDFVRNGRDGVLLAEPSFVQGGEFKSVIVFMAGAPFENISYSGPWNTLLRAICNLVKINFKVMKIEQT